MRGTTFDVMAKTIKNIEFVLVCMSDAYKQSTFCEMEASYAVKCRCHIIPLVMTTNYKADGWLGVLTSARVYIDFPKLGFDKTYQELKKQRKVFRMNDSSSMVVKHRQVHHNPCLFVNNIAKTIPSIEKITEPRPVT